MAGDVQTSLHFLEQDALYDTEKVYEMKYETPIGLPRSNMKIRRQGGIPIQDVRGREREMNFQNNGFCVLNIDCDLAIGDYDDETKLQNGYMRLAAHKVQQVLGATRVQIIDYTVCSSVNPCKYAKVLAQIRKRDEQFPKCHGGFYAYNQPSALAHIGKTSCDSILEHTMLIRYRHYTLGYHAESQEHV